MWDIEPAKFQCSFAFPLKQPKKGYQCKAQCHLYRDVAHTTVCCSDMHSKTLPRVQLQEVVGKESASFYLKFRWLLVVCIAYQGMSGRHFWFRFGFFMPDESSNLLFLQLAACKTIFVRKIGSKAHESRQKKVRKVVPSDAEQHRRDLIQKAGIHPLLDDMPNFGCQYFHSFMLISHVTRRFALEDEEMLEEHFPFAAPPLPSEGCLESSDSVGSLWALWAQDRVSSGEVPMELPDPEGSLNP